MAIRVKMWHKHPWRISSTFSAIKGQHWQKILKLLMFVWDANLVLSRAPDFLIILWCVIPAFTQHSHWTKNTFTLYRDLVSMALNIDKRTNMIFFVLLKWSQVYKSEQLQQSIWFWKKEIYMYMLLKLIFTLVFYFSNNKMFLNSKTGAILQCFKNFC